MTKKLQKQPYRGFIFEFEPERASRMADLLSAGYEVSDSFSADDWGLERKEIFLIVETDPTKKLKTLIGAVFVERMHGTGGTRNPNTAFPDRFFSSRRFSSWISSKRSLT